MTIEWVVDTDFEWVLLLALFVTYVALWAAAVMWVLRAAAQWALRRLDP